MDRDRHDQVQIVTFAPEDRVWLDPDGDEQIAGFAPIRAGVPFPRDQDTRPVVEPW